MMKSQSTSLNASTIALDNHTILAFRLWLARIEKLTAELHLQDLKLLIGWLVDVEDIQPMIDYYDSYEHLPFPVALAPDICATCYKMHGWIQGGRVREGCIDCEDEETLLLFGASTVRDSLYVNDAYLQYLFAKAILLWSTTRQPAQQRTGQYLRKQGLFIGESNARS